MIKHTVLFRLNRPVDDTARDGFLAALREFGAEPPHAEGPATVSDDLRLRPEGRSVSEGMIEVRFADEEAFNAYLADPKHVALVQELLTPNCESWLSLQSEV